jgi:hypothetical protein
MMGIKILNEIDCWYSDPPSTKKGCVTTIGNTFYSELYDNDILVGICDHNTIEAAQNNCQGYCAGWIYIQNYTEKENE